MKRALILVWILMLSVCFAGTAFGLAYPLPSRWEFKFIDVEVVRPLTTDANGDGVPDAWNPAGPAVQVFTSAEDPLIGDGVEDNWGIARITSIVDRSTNTVVWSDGDNGQYLSVMFGGLDVFQVTAIDSDLDGFPDNFKTQLNDATSTAEGFVATGAFLDVYLENQDDLDFAGGPGDRTDFRAYTDFTDGILQGEFDFREGVIDQAGNQALTDVDTDAVTDPFTGDGTGYLDAVAGSGPLADAVDTDGFLFTNFSPADVFLLFDFRPHPDTGLPDFGWTVNSEDPAIGNAPEPATLLLLGSGLLGLAIMGRRKVFKK